MANERKYPLIDVMIGGESTITREMSDEEKDAYDFFCRTNWTPEQITNMRNNRGERTH